MVPEVVALARAMRAGGARVGTGEVEAAARALGAVGASREDAYLGLRAVLCSRREDLAIFDAAFTEVFAGARAGRDTPPFEMPPGVELALPRVADPGAEPSPGREPSEVRPAAWSDIELLIDKDFSEYTDEERARVRAVVEQLARRGPTRRSRRLRAARLRGVRPDLQRTLRASLRWGGEPMERRWREPAQKPRKLVLICDVSGSMAPYARVLLQYLHAAVATHRRVEVFAFGTRLTRLTRELGVRDPDLALMRASEAVDDWSGGTRIGHSLGVLNREYGRRLGRSAHRVVWLNPLKAAPDYEPLARGMAAALPHTDHFLAGSSLASLAELATILEETR
jgi:uncharacterized protein with von Willebrand factor type A (vWA) domain